MKLRNIFSCLAMMEIDEIRVGPEMKLGDEIRVGPV